ncbi:3-oxoacyl-ACP reductase [Mycolicibacterium agri]|uniref:3-oxoacyl-[acyl-carrier-protein] reductase MabA n=1 Tax=Mycolicibacterium agri TaxID=36811 RepID=A0A2A7NC32_MYCAG|nr:SDR family oxidoreductase [Mycolicibacterium agri]PEG41682.1 3-oxoacyl-ACP reductase [Mycolicibacterium agri]GFG50095.1 3-oxoacyl-ACP reductase [Mycolicibacterium agri]
MDLGLANRTALVLGAGGGLGGAIAVGLAREGASVALADVNEEALNSVSGEVAKYRGRVHSQKWNLADIEDIDRHVSEIEDRLGTIEILVNITGGPPPTPVADQPVDLWQDSFRSMVLSVIKITDRVLPGMRVRRWGRIITSVSSGVISPIPNLGLSNSLRLALVGWSKTLANEVAADGVTANVIAPGRIGTDRIRFLDEAKARRESREVADVVEESVAAIPMGRYGRPQEYADAVAFLASNQASYITGSITRVDGGYIPAV